VADIFEPGVVTSGAKSPNAGAVAGVGGGV
jgi:hypothetical protein